MSKYNKNPNRPPGGGGDPPGDYYQQQQQQHQQPPPPHATLPTSWSSTDPLASHNVAVAWLLLPYAVAIVVIFLTLYFGKWLRSYQETKRLRKQYNAWIQRARQERDDKVHACLHTTTVTTTDEQEELSASLSAVETHNLLMAGKLDPVQHVIAIAKRCRRIGRDESGINAVCEELYDQAVETASLLDKTAASTLPLYGIPISCKEQLSLTGTYSTGGLACRLKQRDDKDSVIVSVLKRAGAIPVLTANVTQLMMLPESMNRIWGRSCNPWDLTRTPGGSSGGDGALLATNSIPISVASDVAGSIRIPASFCGVTGFKPTSMGRVSGVGNMRPRKDNKSGTGLLIPTVIGPMARTVDDCALFMKAVLTEAMFRADVNLVPIPFDEAAYKSTKKLKIGYFETDGWFEPCPTSKRAVQETVAALQKAGHLVVPFEPPTSGWHSYGLLVAINSADGNMKAFIDALEGEELMAEYHPLYVAANLPHALRWLAMHVLLDKRRAHLLGQGRSGGLNVTEFFALSAALADLRTVWATAMTQCDLDALVYPAMPVPALPHGLSGNLTSCCSYMFLANMLLWPAGVVPVTTIRPDEAHYPFEDLPVDQRDAISKMIQQQVMKDSAGMPIGVSVMTPLFRDETCLRIMKEIETAMAFSAKPTAYLQTKTTTAGKLE